TETATERRSLLGYLPPDAILTFLDGRSGEEWDRSWLDVQRLHQAEVLSGGTPEDPEQIFLTPTRVREWTRLFPTVHLGSTGAADRHVSLRILPPEPIDRDMTRLGEMLRSG